MSIDGGVSMTPTTSVFFPTTGLHTVVYDLLEQETPDDMLMLLGNGAVNVQIGDGVKKVGLGSFYFNTITGLSLPSTIKYIDDMAFSNNGLTSLTLPEGLETIGSTSFAWNDFTSLVFPSTLKGYNSIGASAFCECQYLTSVTFTSTNDITYFFNGTFYNDYELKSFNVPQPTRYASYNFLEGAFRNCRSLTGLTFPSKVAVYFGDESCAGCTSLSSITNTFDCAAIGSFAFSGCTALTTIDVSNSDWLGASCFVGVPATAITFTTGPVNIHTNSFNYMPNLQKIVLGRKMNDYTFSVIVGYGYEQFGVGCSSLTEIHMTCTEFVNESSIVDFASSDLPSNGIIYYYYKEGDYSINSKSAAEAFAALIGKGWTAVSGGILP